ncbi:MAG: hypothetical protein ABIK09_17835, partial [Pseudomonadota bacterium]
PRPVRCGAPTSLDVPQVRLRSACTPAPSGQGASALSVRSTFFAAGPYSGAGKTTLLSEVAEELRGVGRPVLVVHCGDFLSGGVYDEIEAEHLRGHGRIRVHYSQCALHRYDGFRRLIHALRTAQRTGREVTVRLDGLWDPAHRDNSKTVLHVVHPETVLLLEGNVFLSAEVRDLVDAAWFVEADVVGGDDLDRVLARTRRRQGRLGRQGAARYRNNLVWFRRPFVEEHRRRNLALFDSFIEIGEDQVSVVDLGGGR